MFIRYSWASNVIRHHRYYIFVEFSFWQEHATCLGSKLWRVYSFCANYLLHQYVLVMPLEIRISCCTPSFAQGVRLVFAEAPFGLWVSFCWTDFHNPVYWLLHTFFKHFDCQSLSRRQDQSFGYRSLLRQPFDTWFKDVFPSKHHASHIRVLDLPLYQLSVAAGRFYWKCKLRKLGLKKGVFDLLLPLTYKSAYLRASRGEAEETEKNENDSTEDARWSELKKDEAVGPIQ